VHDDVIDVALLANPAQHELQLRSVGGAGGLAAVDVLINHVGIEPLSRAAAGVTLGMQRVAVIVVVGGGLFGGRHAQVEHRLQRPVARFGAGLQRDDSSHRELL
jgi:hypothetical protein